MVTYVGTAGYVYPHWRKGAFYPAGLPQARELTHYLANFPAVEINATWHAFPRLTTLQKWRQSANPQTRFALKAPAVITHEKRLRHAHHDITSFIRVASDGLSTALGPLLFQCPPSLLYSLPLLQTFLACVHDASRQHGPLQVALEFRSPDWFCPPVFAELAAHDVALVHNVAVRDADYSHLDDHAFPHTRAAAHHPTSGWRYLRFHGSKNPGIFTDFPDNLLRQFVSDGAEDEYAFFLNDAAAIATNNAMRYARLSAQARKTDVKSLFGGLVPEWTRRKRSIDSFFTASGDTTIAAPKPRPISMLSHKAKTHVSQNSPPVTSPGLGKLKPKAETKAASKLIKQQAIRKKRNNSGAKDIASFFSPASAPDKKST